MKNRSIIHIVDGVSSRRAQLARIVFAGGHHAEIYAELAELLAHAPAEGVVVAYDEPSGGSISNLIQAMARAGQWLPVIAVSESPATDMVVRAVRAGALDYIRLPLEFAPFAEAIAQVERVAHEQRVQRARAAAARQRVARLSRRELEVLNRLVEGCSNKTIARELEISPRTVEIHRTKMMGKLGARHAAEAVRLCIDAASFREAA